MSETRYLIVGGGMTGHAAAAAIREADPTGSIAMISAEPDRPYARPPLTKGLWLGKPEESVWLPEVAGLAFHAGRRAVALDPRAREVRDDQGEVHRYEKLLLATGGVPRRLPFGGDRVVYYRTLADYRRLRAVEGRRIVVIGGGFIGSEIAASLAANGKQVTMIFPEEAIGARSYPAELAAFVTGYFGKKGVRVLAGDNVATVEPLGERLRVEHEDAALSMGRAAGRNMAGAGERYAHLPFFYSDLFDLGYEAVGRLDPGLEIVVSWKRPFREGVVYYLDGDRVRGILLWGIFGQVDAARALISGRAPVARSALADAIPT